MRRRIKQTADFCRWSLYVVIVLAAVFLLLCRLLITQLYFYQTQIESFLSDSLSTFVVAEEARGVWDTLYPVIELEYLRVGQDQVDPGLKATFVRAVPNYLQSLRLQTAIWEELSIVDLTIELNQRADGGWSIGGIDAGSGAGSSGATGKLADMLFRSRSIEIQNLSLDYRFQDGRYFNLKFSEMRAENESDFHRISLKGQVDGEAKGIEAELELTGPDYQFRNMQGLGYVALSGADMSNLFSALLEGYIENSDDAPIFAEGEMWFELAKGSQVQMFGDVSVSNIEARGLSDSASFNSQLRGSRTASGDWRLDLVGLDITLADQQLDVMGLSMQTAGEGIRILTEQIALEDLAGRLQNLGGMPERLSQALNALAPRGDLVSASLSMIGDQQGSRWLLDGNIEAAYSQSYMGIPRIENLSAYFSIDPDGGNILIDSVDTSVHFEKLFEQKIFNRELEGQVGWRLNREDGELHVYSDAIVSKNEYGAEGVSQFHLVTPITSGDFASDLTLVSSLKNASANLWPLYLPIQADDSLIQWFGDSEIMGDIPEVGFIYRGYLRGGEEYPRTFQLTGDIDEAELQFAPGWPRLQELNSRFGLSDGSFYSYSPISQLQGVTLVDSKVEIGISGQSQLRSSTLLAGDLNDIVDLIRKSPARDRLGSSLDDLQFSGHAEVSLSLEQPIAQDITADQVYIEAHSALSNIDLRIEPLDLSIESISGALVYDDDGLRTDGYSARLWGKNVRGSMTSDRETGAKISLDSEIEMERLATWIDNPLIANLEGSLFFESDLSLPYEAGANALFQLRSDSYGISTTLPQPLAKAADTVRPFEIQIEMLSGQGQQMEMQWGDLLDLSLHFNQNRQPVSATFGLSAERPQAEAGKLTGNIMVEKFDYLDWQPLLEGEKQAEFPLSPQIDIHSEHTWFSGIDIGASRSRLLLYEGDLEVGFSTGFGEGRFVVDLSGSGDPQRLTFNRLDIAEFPGVADYVANKKQMTADSESQIIPVGANSDDASTDFDPRKFPPMVLDLVELRYGDRDLGQWFFQLDPHELGLSISNIQARFAGSEIAVDSMSRLEWGYNGSEHVSELDVQANLGDVGKIFEQVRESAAVSSESGTLAAHLGWLGVPWQPSLEQLTGTVDLVLNDGKFDAEAQGDELLKLIALFSIDNWGRRLKFDFSDITEGGTGYRSFHGNFGVENGLVTTLSPVQISLTTGSLKFLGDIDLIENQVYAELVATLPVRNNLAWVTAAFMGIPAAAGVWLFGELFKDELDSMASVTYLVTGDLDAPDIKAKSAVDAQSSGASSDAGPL